MTHKKEVVFSLLFVIMVLCTGCSDKDNGDTSKNNRTSGESFVQEETIESTDNIDNTDNADGIHDLILSQKPYRNDAYQTILE